MHWQPTLTELPFGLAGRVFASPMPFGIYDREGRLYDQARLLQVTAVVVLTDRLESLQKAGRDLTQFYLDEGLEVVDLPITDYEAVSGSAMTEAVRQTIKLAADGQNILIHCSLGEGRTGMFAACMASRVLSLTGDEALVWIRRSLRGAVETVRQEELVRRFADEHMAWGDQSARNERGTSDG